MKPSDYLKLIALSSKPSSTFKGSTSNLGSPYSVVSKSRCPKCALKGLDRSSNNLIEYSNGGKHCFACGYTVVGNTNSTKSNETKGELMSTNSNTSNTNTLQTLSLDYDTDNVMSDRGIMQDTFRKYKVEVDNTKHIYPYYDITTKALVALKTRQKVDGEGNPSKKFFYKGQGNLSSLQLFGSHCFPKGSSKVIVVTEGEVDCMSAYQLLSGRYPCVSIPGADTVGKVFKANYDYLDSFETIVICFDNDEAGKKATSEAGKYFPLGKVKVLELPNGVKDVNDILTTGTGDHALFQRCFTNAKTWTPTGIRFGSSILGEILDRTRKPATPFPWQGLNDTVKGIRAQELITITAGTGQGKSSVMRELAYYLFKNTNEKIGMIYLEESNAKTGESLISISLNKPLHHIKDKYMNWDGTYVTPELGLEWETMINKGYEEVLNNERFSFFDHFGSTDLDTIVGCVRYMAVVLGAKFVFLDHLSIIVSSQENGDERRAIDEVVTRLRSLAQEVGITLFLVSHLKRTGESHEEGGKTSLNDLRGSAAIGQLSDVVIGIERDQQADDVKLRNTTFLRVLKCREIGITGLAVALEYNRDTGRLVEVPLEEAERLREEQNNKGRRSSSRDEDEADMVAILKGAGGFKKLQ